jgi:hypothetical protein
MSIRGGKSSGGQAPGRISCLGWLQKDKEALGRVVTWVRVGAYSLLY